MEARLADIGSARYEDDRELGYQFADATALWSHSFSRLAVFARAGLGTFRNDGDFDVELNHPAHAVAGIGAYIRATPSLDVRLSVSAHDEDAIFGSLDLVWAFQKRTALNGLSQTATDTSVPGDSQTAAADNVGSQTASEQTLEQPAEQPAEQTTLSVAEPDTATINQRLPNANPLPQNTAASDLPMVIRNNPTQPVEPSAPAALEGLLIEPVPEPSPEVIASRGSAASRAQQADGRQNSGNQSGVVSRPFTPGELPQVELIRGAEVGAPDAGRVPVSENITEEVPTSESSSEETPELRSEASPVAVPESVASIEPSTGNRFSDLPTGALLPIGPIVFAQSGALLTAEARQQIQQVVTAMSDDPELNITIEAHASAVGDSDLMMLLSRRRALAVVRALVDGGVQATRLRPVAFGDAVPVSANASTDSNDRVELRVR